MRIRMRRMRRRRRRRKRGRRRRISIRPRRGIRIRMGIRKRQRSGRVRAAQGMRTMHQHYAKEAQDVLDELLEATTTRQEVCRHRLGSLACRAGQRCTRDAHMPVQAGR
jgi:hypothetical protein